MRRVPKEYRAARFRKEGNVVYLFSRKGAYVITEVLRNRAAWDNPSYVVESVDDAYETFEIHESFILGPDSNRNGGIRYEPGYDSWKTQHDADVEASLRRMWRTRRD